MFFYSLESQGDEYYFGIEPAAGWVSQFPDTALQARDQAATGVLNVCRHLIGKSVNASRVMFREKRPLNFLEYESELGCPVIFSSKANAVVFPRKALDQQVSSQDVGLYQLFNEMLSKQMRQARQRITFSQLVSSRLDQIYGLLIPSVSVIAFQFNMTARTFQRKLAEESTTYRQIVDDHRGRIATSLLKGRASIKSVSSMLGYSDPSTFRRAFKKWLNENPKTYKKRMSS
jgi:AraC-like DNA-binding protein